MPYTYILSIVITTAALDITEVPPPPLKHTIICPQQSALKPRCCLWDVLLIRLQREQTNKNVFSKLNNRQESASVLEAQLHDLSHHAPICKAQYFMWRFWKKEKLIPYEIIALRKK